jgi:hypothetical protein
MVSRIKEFIRRLCHCLFPEKELKFKISVEELQRVIGDHDIRDQAYVEAYYYNTHDVIR